MKCERCKEKIEASDSYIFLDNFEKNFCCENCMARWLLSQDIATWEIND